MTEAPVSKMSCPLCQGKKSSFFCRDRISKKRLLKDPDIISREYFSCDTCRLIFTDKRFYLTMTLEKTEYDLHQNDCQDEGYRNFLNRLFMPLMEKLGSTSCQGLEFGCGPGPLLAKMLGKAGHSVDLYDIFYQPNDVVFSRQYDFITATEVFEHLQCPGNEIERLWSLLKPGGVLAVMTKLALDSDAFSNWHYKNDPTHIVFFSKASFTWLAEKLNARLEFADADVIFLSKSLST